MRLINHFDLSRGEICGSWSHVEVFELDRAMDDSVEVGGSDEHIVDGSGDCVARYSNTARGVPLGVAINEQGPLFGDGETSGEVDSGSGFSHPALLISDGYDFTHGNGARRLEDEGR
jgi:hypothetical protein